MDDPFTEDEVAKAISSLKAGEAVGPDGVSLEIFMHGVR